MAGLGLPKVGRPEQLGLSSDRLERISATFRDDVERGLIPGAVLLIARGGRIGYAEAFGWRDREKESPMGLDAIFRIASMTKPVTSVAAMILAEEGKLQIAAPVSDYLPELRRHRARPRQAHNDSPGPFAPHLGPDLRRVRRHASADDLARRQSDDGGPDQRGARGQACPSAADVRAGDYLGVQYVHRCSRTGR